MMKVLRYLFAWGELGVLVFFLRGKGDSKLLLLALKSCLVWEFPVVVEHEDVWSNKEAFWKLPHLAFPTFLIFFWISKKIVCWGTYRSLCCLLSVPGTVQGTRGYTIEQNCPPTPKHICCHGACILMFQRPHLPKFQVQFQFWESAKIKEWCGSSMSTDRRTPGHKYLLESPFPVWKKRSFMFDRAKEGRKMNCLLVGFSNKIHLSFGGEVEVGNGKVGDYCKFQIILTRTKFSLLWYVNWRFVVEWNWFCRD